MPLFSQEIEKDLCVDDTLNNHDIPGKSPWRARTMLDLGAGDGHVTQVIAHMSDEVHVTEASPIMRSRLSNLGYK